MSRFDVRLILCDVDGTLFPKGNAVISDHVFSAIRKATDAGIKFVIASGRSYPDLCSLFKPILPSVSIVASDGGIVCTENCVQFSYPLQRDFLKKFLAEGINAGCSSALLYGKEAVYCIGEKPEYTSCISVLDTEEIKEDIYKIAFWKPSLFSKTKIRNFVMCSAQVSEVYADASWLEFVSAGTHKGIACQALQKLWNISPAETVAFGDNVNDYGMLRCAQVTFSAPDAITEIKRMCKYSTDNVPDEIIRLTQERGIL